MEIKVESFNKIEIIYITVEEKINKNNLKNFLKTNLELNNIYSYKNKKIHLSYIYELKEYQVSIIDISCIPIFYIFINIKMDSTTVFICDDFFVLYKDYQPYYIKKLDDHVSKQDIKTYIQSKLNLEIFQIKEISKEQLNTYIENSQTNNYKYKFIYLDTNKSFIYYCLYVILIFSCFMYFFDTITNNKAQDNNNLQIEKELLNKLANIKKEKQFTYVSQILLYIFEKEKQLHIDIQSISYNNEKINIIVSSNKKDKLFDFLSSFNSTHINNINDEKNKYILNATIIPIK